MMPYTHIRKDDSVQNVAASTAGFIALTRSAGERRCRDADRQMLYLEFATLFSRLVRQYGNTVEMRRDMVGALYCRFCALLDTYDPERGVPLKPYLVRQLSVAAYDMARSHMRVQRREVAWEGVTSSRGEDPTAIWDEALHRRQIAVIISIAIQQLPQRQRQVVTWRYFEGYSFEEIATRLDVKTATARSLLRHGLIAMRRQMQLALA